MKKFLAALVTFVALVWVPTVNSEVLLNVKTDQASLQTIGRKLGCGDLTVYTNTTLGGINGQFAVREDGAPFIRLLFPLGLKDQYRLGIFLHELGHCMQYEENENMISSQRIELDADKRGANLACMLGMDGISLEQELLDYFQSQGYNGDPGHGTIEQRKAAAGSAEVCLSQRHFA